MGKHRSRKIKAPEQAMTRLVDKILPDGLAARLDLAMVDVANQTDADQRHMVRSEQTRTVRRLTRIERMARAGMIEKHHVAACEWYASAHALGYDTIGVTAQYGEGTDARRGAAPTARPIASGRPVRGACERRSGHEQMTVRTNAARAAEQIGQAIASDEAACRRTRMTGRAARVDHASVDPLHFARGNRSDPDLATVRTGKRVAIPYRSRGAGERDTGSIGRRQ